MKKIFGIIGFLVVVGVVAGIIFGGGSNNATQDDGQVTDGGSNTALGNYDVVIESCRLSKDYSGNDIAIVTFKFTNNSENAASFIWSVSDKAFQSGVELETCYVAEEYNHELAEKEIKTGVTFTVEQAYVLGDTTSEIEIEVSEYMSFSSKKITKKFTLQ